VHQVPTVVLAESPILRQGLVSLLEKTHYRVTSAVEDLSETSTEHGGAELVVIGIAVEGEKMTAALRKLRRLLLTAKLVVVADRPDQCDPFDLLDHGADGCIVEVAGKEVLLKALDLALLQQRLIVIGHSGPLTRPPPLCADQQSNIEIFAGRKGGKRRLSERELRILTSLARGDSNKVIAQRLNMTVEQTKAQLRALLRRIGVENRTQAAIWARENAVESESIEEDISHTQPLSQAAA
jgi:two-component system, NarL family, nitrate/nitrite response regulator NarL